MPNLAIFALPFLRAAMGSERMLEHVLASLNRHAGRSAYSVSLHALGVFPSPNASSRCGAGLGVGALSLRRPSTQPPPPTGVPATRASRGAPPPHVVSLRGEGGSSRLASTRALSRLRAEPHSHSYSLVKQPTAASVQRLIYRLCSKHVRVARSASLDALGVFPSPNVSSRCGEGSGVGLFRCAAL